MPQLSGAKLIHQPNRCVFFVLGGEKNEDPLPRHNRRACRKIDRHERLSDSGLPESQRFRENSSENGILHSSPPAPTVSAIMPPTWNVNRRTAFIAGPITPDALTFASGGATTATRYADPGGPDVK